MHTLVLIRHSFAEDPSSIVPDIKRQLVSRGVEKAESQRDVLVSKGIFPDMIVSSHATRAMQTSEIILSGYSGNLEFRKEPFLYEEYSTADFIDYINGFEERYKTVFIVGHNPTISVMAYRLCNDFIRNLEPCSVTVFDFNSSWKEVEVDTGKVSSYF